jgi:serine/threonine-protein kinase
VIERHALGDDPGYWWETYDFASSDGLSDIFQNPLGPFDRGHSFRHSTGEVIFALPNGLQGYLSVNNVGRIEPKGVQSCVSCHGQTGLISRADEIRSQYPGTSDLEQKIRLWYPAPEAMTELLKADVESYQAALARATPGPSTRSPARTQ